MSANYIYNPNEGFVVAQANTVDGTDFFNINNAEELDNDPNVIALWSVHH